MSPSPFVQVEFPSFKELNEPLLAFGARTGNRGIAGHPLIGLRDHGPFSLSRLDSYLPNLRLGLIAPADELDVAGRLTAELRATHQPGERRDYLIDYPGFHRVFGLDISAATSSALIALPADLDDRLQVAVDPRQVLTGAIVEAVGAASAQRSEFDVLLVRLPERWSPWFWGAEGDDFDLHHFIKVTAAPLGIPTQIIGDGALEYRDRCSVAWRLAIAAYTKAGGVPWKLADTAVNGMYVGIGYSLRRSGEKRFVIGAAQVFDEHGTGLQFVGSAAAEDDGTRIDGTNPFLTRPQMQTLLSRTVSLYQRQHSGSLPKRVVVHKNTQWRPRETEGAFDALGRIGDVELIQIQHETPWRGVRGTWQGSRGASADSWPVHRGTMLHLSGSELLVWTQGNAPSVSRTGNNFYKEGRGLPHPVLLRRWAGHSSAEEVAADVLALTKMDWNNDGLYNAKPVTLEYASTLAHILKLLPKVPSEPCPFRLFM